MRQSPFSPPSTNRITKMPKRMREASSSSYSAKKSKSEPIPAKFREYVRKQVQKNNKTIYVDYIQPSGFVPAATLSTVSSFEVSEVNPYAGAVVELKDQRLSNDLIMTKVWQNFNISCPAGASNVMRFTLVRYPNSGKAGITVNDVLEFNSNGNATLSPFQDNSPYEILYDKTVVMNNSDGTSSKTFRVLINKSWKNGKRIQYSDDSLTGQAIYVLDGLTRLYVYQHSAAVGTACTITNNNSRWTFQDVGDSKK